MERCIKAGRTAVDKDRQRLLFLRWDRQAGENRFDRVAGGKLHLAAFRQAGGERFQLMVAFYTDFHDLNTNPNKPEAKKKLITKASRRGGRNKKKSK